ncbi:MAG: DUF6428 family protein [Flavobacteriaceae bacterium]|nr:DUF6428 family protein [Flavobacteriaceae bacterium]
MKLSAFKSALSKLDSLQFVLPQGKQVPAHVHLTEIGELQKNFIDCGGTIRISRLVSMQLWYAEDTEHRLHPEKLLDIIKASERQLSLPDEEVEIEYQQGTIGKYRVSFQNGTFQLVATQTDCLAKDQCIVPEQKPKVRLTTKGIQCDPQSGCC